jgi:hypothetical protein
MKYTIALHKGEGEHTEKARIFGKKINYQFIEKA